MAGMARSPLGSPMGRGGAMSIRASDVLSWLRQSMWLTAPLAHVANADRVANRASASLSLRRDRSDPTISVGSTYRYRDAGKRRVYMRDLMRRKRAIISA